MIHAVIIVNNAGKPRLTKFYTASSPSSRTKILSRIFDLISVRDDTLCNFVELPPGFGFNEDGTKLDPELDQDLRIVYRHYATLYFVFVVDQSESELGILDLIQVFVESLDRCFENVCELDLIFRFDQVHTLLSCIVTGGLVLDTNIESIHRNFSSQQTARKTSAGGAGLNMSSTLAALQGSAGSVAVEGWDRLTASIGGRGR